ncbi:DUF302 domain-containing protein [Virgibacillus halophilus]|uniref:DUF302 domain-containing protein n=1 Tax=Tigheibacillus halophilus TaxID=361280 RepID=A0ABU5C9T4_9BACI|nr:DUF302 domain-containing protein [Virgibacillus halophilus]
MFDYTVDTKQSVAQAIETLTRHLKEDSFGVLWNLDMKATLEGKGFEYDHDYHVLEVCNPEAAKKVLTQNQLAGYILPCKIAVYEDGSTTKIGMPKPTELINLVGDRALLAFASDFEKRLKSCIKASANVDTRMNEDE